MSDMKLWIGRDPTGTFWIGVGAPDVLDAGTHGEWTGQEMFLSNERAGCLLKALEITLEPGEAHALEISALDYGWVMEDSDESAEICKWMENECGDYETTCGNVYLSDNGGVSKNGFQWCPFCGKQINNVPYTWEEGELEYDK